jgi:eukaryotic-like serine/threonine-protein kinase
MLNPGTLLGKYRLLAKLGAGGMGEVYLAKDTVLDRQIAIKVLPPDVASDESRMRRFVQEAKAAASLNHPNIAHVYEVGEDNGVHFIAMEYVDGETLSSYIRRSEKDFHKVLKYLQSVAEALSKAHSVGIVHRDLKPDNIMISRDDHVKVLDFGLAKLIEIQAPSVSNTSSEIATAPLGQLSTSGLVIGTAGYMSPEQAQGKTREIDHRTDIFSFGCILYESLTGVKAFAGKDVLDSLHKIVHQATPVIKDQNPEAPSELQRILRRCLAKDREERYQTMKDVAIELKELRHELQGRTESSEAKADHDKQTQAFAKNTASLTNKSRYFVQPKFVMLGLFLIAALLAAFLYYLRQTANVTTIDSIAVLPFANQNNDANVEYLCDGLTESIINSLAKLPHLRVASRSSVFQFKSKEVDPVTAGKKLGVGAVLTGRLAQRGDDLLITFYRLSVASRVRSLIVSS